MIIGYIKRDGEAGRMEIATVDIEKIHEQTDWGKYKMLIVAIEGTNYCLHSNGTIEPCDGNAKL